MLGTVTERSVLQQRDAPTETRVDAEQHVRLKRLFLGDRRARRFIDEILTSDSINALLLMDCSVLLPKATQ